MEHTAQERRIHRIYVTRNTEYHVRVDRCVAVRDRRSDQWLGAHQALNQRVVGALQFKSGGIALARNPQVGDSLVFDGPNVVTSPVVSVERPLRHIVARYPM